MALRMTRAEFDRFWDDVLGDNWYIDESNLDDALDVDDPAYVLDIEYLSLGWQGSGLASATEWISRRDLDNGVRFETLVRRWRAKQTMKVAAVEVPADRLADLAAAVRALGGTVLTR